MWNINESIFIVRATTLNRTKNKATYEINHPRITKMLLGYITIVLLRHCFKDVHPQFLEGFRRRTLGIRSLIAQRKPMLIHKYNAKIDLKKISRTHQKNVVQKHAAGGPDEADQPGPSSTFHAECARKALLWKKSCRYAGVTREV
jgi:hypothetical protein